MTKQLTLACFIDAFGWEAVKESDFLAGVADHRYRTRTVFGYSNAVIPSILTGRLPAEHEHWSFYYYSPQTSPFADLRFLRFLDKGLKPLAFLKHRVRNKLSQWVKRKKGFTGYFQLYNVPFEFIHLFDYCEKRDYFVPGGLNRGKTIFDVLSERGVPYYKTTDPIGRKGQWTLNGGRWTADPGSSLATLHEQIDTGSVRFVYIHLTELDAALHEAPAGSGGTATLLKRYDAFVRDLVDRAGTAYDSVKLLVFSDHGMAPVRKEIDLIARIEATGLKFGQDYVAFYDSTSARFWFPPTPPQQARGLSPLSYGKAATTEPRAEVVIKAALAEVPDGRVLADEELEQLGTLFDGRRYGELIFLLDEGVIIVPSFMGEKGIAGMHGYHPDATHSYAALFADRACAPEPNAVTDIFDLMLEGIDNEA